MAVILAATLICLSILIYQYSSLNRLIGRMWIISPLSVFCIGVLIRVSIGLGIVGISPQSMVLIGEYGQYLVTKSFSKEVAGLWVVYMGGIAVVLGGLAISSRAIWSHRAIELSEGCDRDRARDLICPGRGMTPGKEIVKVAKKVVWTIMVLWLIEGIVIALTGLNDRGEMYQFWDSQLLKPNAVFVGLMRIQLVGYFLLPAVLDWSGYKERIGLIVLGFIGPMFAVLSGGRGEALYPLLIIAMGEVTYRGMGLKNAGRIVLGGILVIGLAVYIAAVRDISSSKNESKDWIAKAEAYGAWNSERFQYRLSAIGRELYACSDAYLFEPRNRGKRQGFEGLSTDELIKIVVPRVVTRDRVEKGDGHNIAQRLIGVNVRGWYPCITTPGDLFRRGGHSFVWLGGILMGGVLFTLDRVWLRVARAKLSWVSLVFTILPVSWLKLPLAGTVRELVWQLAVDIPKYILIVAGIGLLGVSLNRRLRSWKRVEGGRK